MRREQEGKVKGRRARVDALRRPTVLCNARTPPAARGCCEGGAQTGPITLSDAEVVNWKFGCHFRSRSSLGCAVE